MEDNQIKIGLIDLNKDNFVVIFSIIFIYFANIGILTY